MVLEQMRVNVDSPLFYSISSDATNKRARKMFPLVVTFFDKDNGRRNKLVDFYEGSLAIFNAISKSLDELKLSPDMITAYSAYNASLNYGQYNSVFQKLAELVPGIVKSNCNCHVLHNAAKYACIDLSDDIHAFINAVYTEFSCSTTQLKEYFRYFNLEYATLMNNFWVR
jgi:hypothetical protein